MQRSRYVAMLGALPCPATHRTTIAPWSQSQSAPDPCPGWSQCSQHHCRGPTELGHPATGTITVCGRRTGAVVGCWLQHRTGNSEAMMQPMNALCFRDFIHQQSNIKVIVHFVVYESIPTNILKEYSVIFPVYSDSVPWRGRSWTACWGTWSRG